MPCTILLAWMGIAGYRESMSTGPPKPPVASDDLKRIRVDMASLAATGHIAVGMLAWLVASVYVSSSRELVGIGFVFVVLGILQKTWNLNNWRR